eukprot:jgi/Pico_ML_1/51960/g2746.t1
MAQAKWPSSRIRASIADPNRALFERLPACFGACMERPSLSSPPFPLEDLALGALAVLLMLPAVLFVDRLLHAATNAAKKR